MAGFAQEFCAFGAFLKLSSCLGVMLSAVGDPFYGQKSINSRSNEKMAVATFNGRFLASNTL